ncbi:MAG: hypothetical protein JW795_21290 [Chitinivibrionales bacterium]|nr:hypothetical protein [Chitinivibrionales bacterium]
MKTSSMVHLSSAFVLIAFLFMNCMKSVDQNPPPVVAGKWHGVLPPFQEGQTGMSLVIAWPADTFKFATLEVNKPTDTTFIAQGTYTLLKDSIVLTARTFSILDTNTGKQIPFSPGVAVQIGLGTTITTKNNETVWIIPARNILPLAVLFIKDIEKFIPMIQFLSIELKKVSP